MGDQSKTSSEIPSIQIFKHLQTFSKFYNIYKMCYFLWATLSSNEWNSIFRA